jgi:hypothetical protein
MRCVACLCALAVPSMIALLSGCGSSSFSGSPSSGSPSSGSPSGASVYVIENVGSGTSASILQFPAASSGSVLPAATLLLPTAFNVTSFALDGSGQIYVGGELSINGPFEILVYAAGATGSATPMRTIVDGFGFPEALCVDASGLLYVGGPSSIYVYSSTANGAETPMRTIQGALTQLYFQTAIAVDASGAIFATNDNGPILAFSPGATGNVAPARVITPTSGSLFYWVALDASGNIFAIDNQTPASGALPTVASVVEFANGATGAATPMKTITASALTYGGGLTLDSGGNVYLVNASFSGTISSPTVAYSVLGFGPTASGNVTPTVNFTSSAWPDAGAAIAVR